MTISDAAKDLIMKTLDSDPSKRLTIEEILAHGFLKPSGPVPQLAAPSDELN